MGLENKESRNIVRHEMFFASISWIDGNYVSFKDFLILIILVKERI